MKKILYVFVCFLWVSYLGYSSEKVTGTSSLNESETKALNLATELFTKLSEDTPFSRADGQKFFGDIKNFYGYTMSFYKKNNFISVKSDKGKSVEVIPIKELPSLSFFGETLRMYRNIFIGTSFTPVFSVERQFYLNKEKVITYFDEDTVTVAIKPSINSATRISLLYSIRHGFFLEDIDVNGIPLFVYLKLATPETPTRISAEFLDLMKKHLLLPQEKRM